MSGYGYLANAIRAGVIGFGFAGRIFHAAVVDSVPSLELACIVQRHDGEAAQDESHSESGFRLQVPAQ
jgi:predicted dehydrogenase